MNFDLSKIRADPSRFFPLNVKKNLNILRNKALDIQSFYVDSSCFLSLRKKKVIFCILFALFYPFFSGSRPFTVHFERRLRQMERIFRS